MQEKGRRPFVITLEMGGAALQKISLMESAERRKCEATLLFKISSLKRN